MSNVFDSVSVSESVTLSFDPNNGTAALTLPLKTTSANGIVSEVGSASDTLPLKTTNANGYVGIVGSASIDLPVKSLSASGGAAGNGSAELFLPSKTVEANGIVGIVGSADITLPVKEIEAAGGDSAVITLPSKEIEAYGIVGQSGESSITLPAKTIEANAQAVITAVATITKPSKTTQALGVTGLVGSFESELPSKWISAAGYAGIIGSASISLPIKTTLFSGYAEITGSAEIYLPTKIMYGNGYPSLANIFRAWALNLRNGALTEYDNFEFNSLAVFNGQVVAASGDGFRVLGTQDKDDTDFIDATVRTGNLSYGDSFVKRAPRIYFDGIALGNMNFTVISDNGIRYPYPVLLNENAGLQSSRVKIGRGQKSRHWQLEISNADGVKFDINSFTLRADTGSRRIVTNA